MTALIQDLQELDPTTKILAFLIFAFICFLIVAGAILFLLEFLRQLRFINTELKRTEGIERQHWLRERRRLWLSLIPFIKF